LSPSSKVGSASLDLISTTKKVNARTMQALIVKKIRIAAIPNSFSSRDATPPHESAMTPSFHQRSPCSPAWVFSGPLTSVKLQRDGTLQSTGL
jgi:hypothetical protein